MILKYFFSNTFPEGNKTVSPLIAESIAALTSTCSQLAEFIAAQKTPTLKLIAKTPINKNSKYFFIILFLTPHSSPNIIVNHHFKIFQTSPLKKLKEELQKTYQ